MKRPVASTAALATASLFSAALLPASLVSEATAQNSSLMQRPSDGGTVPLMSMQEASWFPSEMPKPRVIREHDIISVRVQEGGQYFAEGEAQRRKQASYQAILLEWLTLNGLGSASPNPQQDGDPTIAGALTSQTRAQSDVESRESLTFNIAAEVIGIRPNGNLVIEARRTIQNNDDVWEYYLSGECRAQDVGVGNLVLSRDILHLDVKKTERGAVRNGYSRGWFTRFFDQIDPF